MRTCVSVRRLSVPALVVAVMGAFACSGSPSQPGPIDDSTILSRSQQPDATSPFPARAQPLDGAPIDTDYLEEEVPEETELTADDEDLLAEDAESAEVYEVDGDDLGSFDLEASDLDAHGLTINGATAGGSSTVKVSGIIFDKNRRTLRIAGVKVKAGSVQTTSGPQGAFTLKLRRGDVTIVFKKTGYKTATLKKRVTRALKINVYLTPVPTALSKLSFSDNDVQVGATVNGTVTLTNAAPSGGAKVLLSSMSTTVAKVQSASVTIPAGQTSAPFKVSAESAGTAVIKGTYKNASKTANLRVIDEGNGGAGGGGGSETVVAEFRWDPTQCEVVEESGGDPLLAKCRFDASDSDAPSGSTYKWTFPGNGNVFIKNSPILLNPPLKCGSVEEGVHGRTVTLVITSPSGAISAPRPRSVTFTKEGLC